MSGLVSARGEAGLPKHQQRVRPGELFTSFHFPDSDLNVLLSSSADDNSKCPEYKVSTVRIEKVGPGFGLVGTGSRDADRLKDAGEPAIW
ncbi:MAG: hypothetical protein U0361_10920 [Nitrospiraceae bacterium]